MNSFAIIREANREYARLARDILKRHESFTNENVKYGNILDLAKADGAVTIPSKWGLASGYQYACLTAIDDVQRFWDQYGAAYTKAAREMDALKFVIITRPSPNTFLYFDSVVIIDLLPDCIHSDLPTKSQFAGGIIRGLPSILPLLEAETEMPMIVLSPSTSLRHADSLGPDAKDDEKDLIARYGFQLTASFLEQITLLTSPPSTLSDWGRLPISHDHVDLAKVFRPDPLKALFDADRRFRTATKQPPYPQSVIESGHATGLIEAMEGRLRVVSVLEYEFLLISILSVFSTLATLDVVSVEMLADPFFEAAELYALKLELEGRGAVQKYILTEEEAAAWCLSGPDFPVFSTDMSTIIKFRERGGPHILRDAMREQRATLRVASPTDLGSVSEGLVKALRERLDAHADEMQQLVARAEEIKTKIKRSAVIMGAMTALNCLLPPQIGIPLSLLYSVPAAPDIYRDIHQSQEIQSEITTHTQQPICLFEGVLGKGRPVFRWPWILG
jgi:hypothetical protein